MKKFMKLTGIIAYIAIILFSVVTCGDKSTGDPISPGGNNGGGGNLPTITGTFEGFQYSGTMAGVTITDYRSMNIWITDITIPSTISEVPVIAIGESAFYNKDLTSVTIPNNVTSIGDNAFSGNKLTSVTIPNSVTSIGDNAFSGNKLTSVTIGNNVTIIGSWAFYGNQLTSVTIGNSVTSIGDDAFSDNQLTSVTIPNSVTSIGDAAFSYNQLTSVTIPNSVATIGSGAFSDNQLTSVTIPNNVTNIDGNPFSSNSNLNTINVATDNTKYISVDGVLYVKNEPTLVAWPGGKTPVNIPSIVTTIGFGAFSGNNLNSIYIPSSVRYIKGGAFFGNSLLIDVTIGKDVMIDILSFDNGFYHSYHNVYNSQAGRYIRSGYTWSKQ
jgi:hypothetical protein